MEHLVLWKKSVNTDRRRGEQRTLGIDSVITALDNRIKSAKEVSIIKLLS